VRFHHDGDKNTIMSDSLLKNFTTPLYVSVSDSVLVDAASLPARSCLIDSDPALDLVDIQSDLRMVSDRQPVHLQLHNIQLCSSDKRATLQPERLVACGQWSTTQTFNNVWSALIMVTASPKASVVALHKPVNRQWDTWRARHDRSIVKAALLSIIDSRKTIGGWEQVDSASSITASRNPSFKLDEISSVDLVPGDRLCSVALWGPKLDGFIYLPIGKPWGFKSKFGHSLSELVSNLDRARAALPHPLRVFDSECCVVKSRRQGWRIPTSESVHPARSSGKTCI